MMDNYRGHGTHVAGIVGAETNNSIGIAGICWDCPLYIFKLTKPLPFEPPVATVNSIKNSILDAVELGAKVINCSVGLDYSGVLQYAVEYADANDIVQVYPTGNSGATNNVLYPARFAFSHLEFGFAGYESVISIAATDNFDEKTWYSSYNPDENHVVCSAPGGGEDEGRIYSTTTLSRGDPLGFEYKRGTSMASPMVAGVAGLIRSAFPHLSAPEVRELIEENCDDVNASTLPGFDNKLGYGRINAYKAVGPPKVPTNFIITGDPGESPTLSWSLNSSPTINGYKIYIRYGIGAWQILTTVDKFTSNFTDPGVIIGENGELKIIMDLSQYACYKITAVDTRGIESNYSGMKCVVIEGLNKESNNSSLIRYKLFNPYPNPFNPITTIRFSIPSRDFVEISIFNLLGCKIKTITNSTYNTGVYNIIFNAENLPSGTYIIRLVTSKFQDSKKLTIIK